MIKQRTKHKRHPVTFRSTICKVLFQGSECCPRDGRQFAVEPEAYWSHGQIFFQAISKVNALVLMPGGNGAKQG